MMAQLPRAVIHRDDPRRTSPRREMFNLVAVASDAGPPDNDRGASLAPRAVTFRLAELGNDSRRVCYRRITAHAVGLSAAWMQRRSGRSSVQSLTAGALATGPGGLADLPRDSAVLYEMLRRDGTHELHAELIASAIVALRSADALIVGPLTATDANTPGLIAHLADLSVGAYRALRPPREVVAHPGFAQVARRFQFIQMSHNDARALAAGAIDIGVLGQRMRQIQGDEGEFAITAFGSHGLLRAESRWWEIEPIERENVDEQRAGGAFCAAWVVARCFLDAPPARALAYARSAVLNSRARS